MERKKSKVQMGEHVNTFLRRGVRASVVSVSFCFECIL